MPAACAEAQPMEQPTVEREPEMDPRSVFTPIDAHKTELLLQSLGLREKWEHVIKGLKEGFDVGIKAPPSHTILFRKPLFIQSRPTLHIIILRERGSYRPLLESLLPRGARESYWPLPHLSNRVGAQTQFLQISHDPGSVIPEKPPVHFLNQRRYQPRRVPYGLGHLRGHSSISSQLTAGLPSCNVRYLSRIQDHTCAPRSAELTLHPLGREGASRPGSHVWLSIKRRSIRMCRRHARRYLRSLRVWTSSQMGRRFLRDLLTGAFLDRTRVPGAHSVHWSTLEHREIATTINNPAVHRVRLASRLEGSEHSVGQAWTHMHAIEHLAPAGLQSDSSRRIELAWQADPYLIYLSSTAAFLTFASPIRWKIPVSAGTTAPYSTSCCRYPMDHRTPSNTPKSTTTPTFVTNRPGLVGRCEHLVWNWCDNWWPLGSLEVGRQRESGAQAAIRHWMGRGRGYRAGLTAGTERRPASPGTLSRTIRQCGCSGSVESGPLPQSRDKRSPQECLPSNGETQTPSNGNSRVDKNQCCRRIVQRRHRRFPFGFPKGTFSSGVPTATSPLRPPYTFLTLPLRTYTSIPSTGSRRSHLGSEDAPSLQPSSLRPACRAEERIFQWKGVNTPPPSTIEHPVICYLASIASESSLRDAKGYGAALRKFHIFCDIFSIPEIRRLPASFELIHSFALWAATDPETLGHILSSEIVFETVSVATVRKYISGIRAWHIAQGWPEPLSETDHRRIEWSLRGLQNRFGRRSRPVRPPVTIPMLRALKLSLDLSNSFDACVWAMAACAFWGMMRFGEVSVKSRSDFHPQKHLKRSDATIDFDSDGRRYARLDLPSAKTAATGEVQSVFLMTQSASDLCPIEALINMAAVTPAGSADPLFSWRDSQGDVRPMVKDKALGRINSILHAWGWGTAFGHSFRIGGASFYLAQKVDPEIVRLAGRWKSMAYEAYIRAFELIANRHMGNLVDNPS